MEAIRRGSRIRAECGARSIAHLVDGSVQPYAVTLPRVRPRSAGEIALDVICTGATDAEVKFLQQLAATRREIGRSSRSTSLAAAAALVGPAKPTCWKPSTPCRDGATLGRDLLDPNASSLQAYSMGGAGTWHPACIGPIAGASSAPARIHHRRLRQGFARSAARFLSLSACIYDAVDYAANAFNVPVIAYSGDRTANAGGEQHRNSLEPLNVSMTHLIAPGLAHQFPPEWQKKAEEEYVKHAGPGKGRKEYPDRVWFTTYTLKYAGSDWVELLGLERHYDRSFVDATRKDEGFDVKTGNVRALRLTLASGDTGQKIVTIDGQEVSATPSASVTGGLALY